MSTVVVRFGLVGRVLRVHLKEADGSSADLTGAIVTMFTRLVEQPFTMVYRRAVVVGQPTDGNATYTFTSGDFQGDDFSAGQKRYLWWRADRNRAFSSGFSIGFGQLAPPPNSDVGLYPEDAYDDLQVTL
jgi:hypothetical protein